MTIRQLIELLLVQVDKYPDAEVLIQGTDQHTGDVTLDDLASILFIFSQPQNTLSVRLSAENS